MEEIDNSDGNSMSDLIHFNSSVAIAFGSGHHDMNSGIWWFTLDANRSLSGRPSLATTPLKMLGWSIHSIESFLKILHL